MSPVKTRHCLSAGNSENEAQYDVPIFKEMLDISLFW